MKPGAAVDYRSDNVIRFGVLTEIVHRQKLLGEEDTQWHILTWDPVGQPMTIFLTAENDIFDLSRSSGELASWAPLHAEAARVQLEAQKIIKAATPADHLY